MNVALALLNRTSVTAEKFAPVIVTVVPALPLIGAKLATNGLDAPNNGLFALAMDKLTTIAKKMTTSACLKSLGERLDKRGFITFLLRLLFIASA